MFAPSSIQKIQPDDVEMNKENAPATSDAAVVAPVETDAGANRSVFDIPPPTSEDLSTGPKDSGTQPGPGNSTIFTDFNEAEDSEDDGFLAVRKRKRTSANDDYLTGGVANDSEHDGPAAKKQGWTWKSRQGPTWKGHEIKHGVPIGVWKLSDEPDDERKHVLYGFLDPKFALHARKYPERKDGTRYQGNFPSGTGSWAAKTDTWLLDSHLKALSKKELTEYVRIRISTWNPDEKPEEREALNASAVAEAKVAAAAAERADKSEDKENSARKAKNNKLRKSGHGISDQDSPQRSFGEPSPNHSSLVNSETKASETLLTPSGTPLGGRDSRELRPAPSPQKSILNLRPGSSAQPSTPTRDVSSKFVVKGRDVLIGYWKESCEPEPINKHAIYGVVQANNVFRAKVVPETRDGRPVKGNYPSLQGGCWVNYDTCVLEVYLKDLMRMEIEEYCRFCIADPDYNDGHQGTVIERARIAAKKKVADDAAALGLNVVEYNRKKCDQRDQGAIAREIERQKKRGEVINTSPKPKSEATKPTAIRSNKAKSDAIAQRLKLERKEAKERATANSRADAELAEAMRQSAQEQKALEAQKEPVQNGVATEEGTFNNTAPETPGSVPSKELASSYDDLRQNSNTPLSDVNATNGSEPDKLGNGQVKFYLLDREAQRAKMERWCQRKPTSQYHSLDSEGKKKHVEKHIDQLILRQTGGLKSHKSKRQSGAENLSSASPAQPGAVPAPSPLADVTEVVSTPKTTVQPPGSVSNTPHTASAPEGELSHNDSPTNQASATPVAQKVAAAHERIIAPRNPPVEPSTGNVESNLSAESAPNSAVAPVPTQRPLAPYPKHRENTADVRHTPIAPKYPSILEEPARVSRSEPERDVPMTDAPNGHSLPPHFSTQYPAHAPTHIPTTQVPPPNSYFSQPAGFNVPPHVAAASQRSQSDQYARAQQAQMGQQAYSIPRTGIENQTGPSEQYSRAPQQPQTGQHIYNSPQEYWNQSEKSPRLGLDQTNGAPRQYITPYPAPTSSLPGGDANIKTDPNQPQQTQQYTDLNSIPSHASPLRQHFSSARPSPRPTSQPAAPAPAPAPEIKEGDDGIKYRVRPTGKFSGLFVSLNRDVVNIDNADHIKQLVLMPMDDSPAPLQQAPEAITDVDGVEYKMALNGLFEGFLVGTRRKIITLDWEVDYMKFVVLVPL